MLSAGLQQILFGSTFYPGATVALDFLAGKYRAPGINNYSADFTSIPNLTVTRATPAVSYAQTSAGLLVPFAANIPRQVDQGLLVEEARTNVVLWNRDLTNAAWTKTSATAALDQTGADGTANAASSLTATGANGTALQAITLASSARFQTAYVKRIAGSGVVNMTMDNGATWTAITLTTDWTRVSIPTQTLANPTVGFRIVTSGDKIAVDFVDNENGAFATSPTANTSASVTRAADVVSIGGLTFPAAYTLFAQFNRSDAASTNYNAAVSLNDGSSVNEVYVTRPSTSTVEGYTVVASAAKQVLLRSQALATGIKLAMRVAASNGGGAAQGVQANGPDIATVAVPTLNTLTLGHRGGASAFYQNDYIQKAIIYPTAFSDAQLIAITQ